MSSYIERVLQPGEQVRHFATIHWITYLSGFLVLLLAVAALFVGRWYPQIAPWWLVAWEILSAALAVIAIVMIFRAWFYRWITEIAVTNRRVIFKTGFISRNTKEMQMDKIESVEVLQSIPGRIFDYGDIVVRGTGHGEFTRIRTIAAPLDMRNQITGV
jgi:membrane protein YdbS with pleckstrin-like domain